MDKKIKSFLILIVTVVTGLIMVMNSPTRRVFKTNDVSLRMGEVYKLDVAKQATYKIENEEIATIDDKGVITAKAAGTTKVIVKTDKEEKVYLIEVVKIVEDTNDIENAVIPAIATQKYTGDIIIPNIEVVLNGKKLEPTIDYKTEYKNNTSVGTATIIVTGIGDYTGTKIINFKIEEIEKSKTIATITCLNKTYNGLDQQIASCNGGTVKNATQKDVGEYKISCTGDELHYDANETTCKITGVDIKDTIVSNISEQTYTGNTVEPEIKLSTKTDTLVEGDDYTVEYKNNVEKGTAEAIIEGTGDYTGKKTVQFKINENKSKPKAIITCSNKEYNGNTQVIATCSGGTIKNASKKDVGNYTVMCSGDSSHTDAKDEICKITSGNIKNAIVSNIPSQTYTGKEIKPSVTLTINGKKLENNKDYKLIYSNNIKEGQAEILITGIGNYKNSSKTVNFTIIPKTVTKTSTVITCYNKVYNGSEQVIATCSGGTIKNEVATNAGNYSVTCTGDKYHTNTTKSCGILRADLKNSTIPEIASQIYNNKAVTPTVSVLLNNKKIDSSNYTVSYSNNNKLGTATVKVTGKGNYTGSKSATFEIVKEKTKAIITCSNKEFNGTSQTIATCSGGTIKNSTRTAVGTNTVTCTGDSSHKDADSKTCSITKANIKNATVISIANQAYTGSPITPNVTVKINNKALVKGTDYTISYSNNTSVGTAKVIIAGKGNYAGSKEVTFKILKKATITCSNKTYNGSVQTIATCSGGTISDTGINGSKQKEVGNYEVICKGNGNYLDAKATCGITKVNLSTATISIASKYKRTGTATKPTPAVKIGSATLKSGTDYTYSYSNNDKVGTAKLTITANKNSKNYTGSKTVSFKIVDPATITCANKTYNGSAQVIATCKGGTVSEIKRTDVGTYTVSCLGDENHAKSNEIQCKITQLDISKAMTLSLPSGTEYKYTGKALTPSVTVKYNNKTLTKGTDYTVAYTNNTNKGTATITVTGKGNYKGTKTITFKIVDKLSTTVESVSLNTTSLSLKSKATSTLTATIKPSTAVNKTVTWTSSNPIIARVDQNGKVTGVKPGTATITATTSDGKKTATCKITVTSPNKTIATYESSTLKYWIEYVSEPTKQKTHKGSKINVQSTYMITHLWVSDAYNQVKTAITPKKSSNQTAEYPRLTQAGSTLINNEIKAKGYQSKGLIAVNATGMVTHTKDKNGKDVGWCTACPLDYYGTSIVALQIYEGRVIRDSTNTKYATAMGDGRVMFVNKDGNIIYKEFTSNLTKNKTLRSEVTSEGAKYTFGGVSPYLIVSNYKKTLTSANSVATRQGLCQIDEHNFVLITSHLNGESAESSCGKSSGLQCPRIVHGLSVLDLAEIMESLGCKIGFNLDGGGSVSYFYKTNKTSEATRVKIAAAQRGLSDMLYFVEK